jgi:hypothetical protein
MKRHSAFFITLLTCWAIVVTSTNSLVIAGQGASPTVQGVAYDTLTGKPLPYVTVQVIGTGKSAMVNSEGNYRLILERGESRLKFSHIGYYSATLDVSASDSAVIRDVYLRPSIIQVEGVTVYDKPYDRAQQIIIEAIRRKKDILEKIHDYRFDAYTKLVLLDKSKRDSAEVLLITETQTTSFWEKPNKYKQVITSRRQTANIPAEGNLVSVGEMLNFNKNRIDINKRSIVSPTATDALDNYNYYLKDTLYIDHRRVYRLEIEPKNELEPLFGGFISIADSTYDVVEVDVDLSKALQSSMVTNQRYRQRYAQFQNDYWMPVEISVTADITLNFPGVPPKISIDYRSSLYSYSFEQGTPKGTFGEYSIEVGEQADKIDSLAWAARQTIPLTALELRGYQVIDSTEKAPKSFLKKVLNASLGALGFAASGGYDFVHFSRVEGPYLGLALNTSTAASRVDLWAKPGYLFNEKRMQHLYGLSYRLSERQRAYVGAEYRNKIVNRPVGPEAWYDPTKNVVLEKFDPLDYYRERGYRLFASMKLLNQTDLNVGYTDYDQSSVRVNTKLNMPRFFNLSRLFRKTDKYRANPAVIDGKLRAFTAEFTYDSRKLLKLKGKDEKAGAFQYTVLKLGAEYASPKLVDNDFDFAKYYFYLFRQQRMGTLGAATFTLFGGTSAKSLPPQRLFSIVSQGSFSFRQIGFQTPLQDGFLGDRIFSVYLNHDFGRYLFVKSGLPLIKKIPFTLSIHGGSLWTEFRDHPVSSLNSGFMEARTGYHELGFGVGNLTPSLLILNFAVYCTWQLTDYNTQRFVFSWGFQF